MGLIIHGAGATAATEDEVRAVELPEATESWVPVAHAEVLDRVRGDIIGLGLRITDQQFALWNNGARFFGVLEIANDNKDAIWNSVVGLRNSIDRSTPVSIGLGNFTVV